MRFPISKVIMDINTGAVIVGAVGTVRLAGTSTAATIYAASSGGSAISGSQVTSDSRGEIEFWVDDDDYNTSTRFDIYVTATNYNPFTLDNLYVSAFDASVDHNNSGTHQNGVTFENTSASTRSFELSTRSQVGTLPATYFRPATTDTVQAFDIMPNGSPSENGTHGYAWIDVVNTDCATTNPAMAGARIGIRSTCVEFGSRIFNGGTLLPLYLTMNAATVVAIGTDNNIFFGDSTGTNGQRYFIFTNYSSGASAYTDIQVRGDNYATKYLTLRHFSSAYSYDSSNYADKSEVGAVGSDLLATSSSDVWILPGGGAYSANNNGVQFTTLATLPKVDNNQTMGSASKRWSATYATTVYPGGGTVKWTSGAGTPESAVTAPIGSMYTRTDGGAGTTLYIKESGTGNTGWVAK